MKPEELRKLDDYLKKQFQNQSISVRARPRLEDSAEVYIGDEFVGVITRDDDDEDLSYSFTMAILDFDLEG
ncbi:MAG TPA: DUF3126 family protein [Afifellaceae bacterium]|nr:DUF3126 family protein [Afifellaceae bacterium]